MVGKEGWPIRGLEKSYMKRGHQTKKHRHIATTRPTRPRGPSWWKSLQKKVIGMNFYSKILILYLTSKLFTKEERNLMYSLRSICHPAKNNFKRMNKNNLLCSLGCQNIEDQIHTFTQCPKIKVSETGICYKNIFKVAYQKETIELFLKVDKKKKKIRNRQSFTKQHSTWGRYCQDPSWSSHKYSDL